MKYVSFEAETDQQLADLEQKRSSFLRFLPWV